MRRPLRFPSGQPLPTLRIVEAEAVHLHEDADAQRVDGLVARLEADGVLRNPPVAAALPAGGFVVLDGANRSSALRRLGLPTHLLQIVDYAAPEIRLEVWHHLLREDGPALDDLLSRDLMVEVGERARLARGLAAGDLACGIIAGNTVRGVRAGGGFPGRIAALRTVVGAYNGRLPIYRVLTDDPDAVREEYDRIGALVVFPAFTKEQILALAALPEKLPTGITRHVIPNRALRVNLPLEMLRAPGTLEAKNAALSRLIHERVLAQRVRVYPESTVLFDE
ncbi:MAG: hypothetical protein HY334_05260 [Armatimonadetes bacterium]|nr:hypothetical protein [Armatimonadota bacterium]